MNPPDPRAPLHAAIDLLYNDEPAASRAAIGRYRAEHPQDIVAGAVAAALPFYHAIAGQTGDRPAVPLGMILGDPLRIPAAEMAAIREALTDTERKARAVAAPTAETTLALSMVEAIRRDEAALITRRWEASVQHARRSHSLARKLVIENSGLYDAFFLLGSTQYLLANVPSFLRWVVGFEGDRWDKHEAIRMLEITARGGEFLKTAARQMLVSVYLAERRLQGAIDMLELLHSSYAKNTAFLEELNRLKARQKA